MKKNSRTAAATLAPKAARVASPRRAAPTRRWLAFSPLLIVLAVLAIYATLLGFNFIGFDYITASAVIC